MLLALVSLAQNAFKGAGQAFKQQNAHQNLTCKRTLLSVFFILPIIKKTNVKIFVDVGRRFWRRSRRHDDSDATLRKLADISNFLRSLG
jgi:hypothetical protein